MALPSRLLPFRQAGRGMRGDFTDMEENNLFHGRYFLERLLGRGSFSEVWQAKDTKTGVEVALKIYAPATGLDDHGLDVFAREFSIVVNANHKNLLKPLHYDTCERKPYLVLPYCARGSVMGRVGRFTEEDAWRLLRDVAGGLAWLHAMEPPLIHQDIKPDNIMEADSGDFMITDFGISTHLKSTLRKSLSSAFVSAGTTAYMAPERFGKDNTPIMASDIYSLGATAFEMLSGDTPFGNDGGLLQKKGAEVPELKGDYSAQLKKVIALCLSLQPWERPTAARLEQYAAAALRGETIRFDGEKGFFRRYRWPLAVAAVVLAGAVTGLWLNSRRMEAAREAQEQADRTRRYNDSLLTVAADYAAAAERKAREGDRHDEYYERAYLAAFAGYRNARAALAAVDTAQHVDLPAGLADLDARTDTLAGKLREARASFAQKAALFADDRMVAREFTQRVAAIDSALQDTAALSLPASAPVTHRP